MSIISAIGDENIDEIVDFLTKQAEFSGQLQGVSQEEAERVTTIAITEAMLNVTQHAYSDGTAAYWWMTAAIIDKELNIAFCDRGMGIPNTLPKQGWYEELKSRFPSNDDADMIAAAMEYTRTSHPGNQGRGLGTKDIQNLVLLQKKGHLTIISGKGHYRLMGETNKIETNAISEDVQGTVIQWTVPMQTTNGDTVGTHN